MRLFQLLVFVVAFLVINAHDPDRFRTFPELIRSRGFRLISYYVSTSDDYILTIHRIVPRDFNPSNYTQTRKPVIVYHGMMSSSVDFFVNSPFLEPHDNSTKCGDNFGFCLVMTGRYDVWLPNSRGNDFSLGHRYLSSYWSTYWRFSWDQMATHDVPAVIEFVRRATGHEKMGWIGHSQGSTILFALLAMQPEYARIIQPFVAWAPPVFLSGMTSPMKQYTFMEPLLRMLGGKYIESVEIYKLFQQFKCNTLTALCASERDAMLGPSSSLNVTRLDVYGRFFPAGSSSWTAAHFLQIIARDDFYRFDYGSNAANQVAYHRIGQVPRLDLLNIPANYTIALMYGATDAFIAVSGVKRLKDVLQQAGVNVIDYKVPKAKWNHVDFVWGMGAGGLVYDKTIQILDQYTG